MNYESISLRYDFHSIRFANFLRWVNPRWFVRPMFKFIMENYNHPLTGAEIGVSKGYNAEVILKTLLIKTLYLIEPDYRGIKAGLISDPRTALLRYKSSTAHKMIGEDLDFVYIDGDHSYKAVKQDIKLYYPKVREGGVIGGHDISLKEGVRRAVFETFDKVSVRINDWWIVKGEEK